ncbi:MAG: hypothetical protein ACTSYJ_09125, partial [Candidatus Thorarchaeota archaeon]
NIDANDKECPYCGHSIIQRTEAQTSTLENQGRIYGTTRDEDGNTHIQFGDGQTGNRLPSGRNNIASKYHQGAGSQGSVQSIHLEEKLDRVDRHADRASDLSKQEGSKDMGIALLESMSAIGDLLSFYQSKVSQEAYLGSSRERLSQKEEKITPKLKSIVTFCDRVDSKTQKKMGLSDSDIRKVKTTTTKTLQMIESRMCSGCGAVNRPGTIQCQNCGARL